MKDLVYRDMAAGEEVAVVALVKEVFDEFVAPDYEEAGIREFFAFANPESMRERMRNGGFVLVAEYEGRLVGVLEFFPPDCIAMLFVALRRHGVAKKLMSRAIEKVSVSYPSLSKLVVHSSPYAVQIYEKLGFCRSGDRTKENGIEYVPMELVFER